MSHLSVGMFLFLFGSGFLASFIDSVVGGGGLISTPALLLTGLPTPIVLGTNKLASTMSSLTSTLSFLRSGKVNLQLVRWLFPLSVLGSAIGVFTVRAIPSTFLKPLIIVLLIAVTIYTIFKKNWGKESSYSGITKKVAIVGALTALVMGFYDGFFGPGTGSFLMFVFLMLGFDFVGAAGNAKVLNFGSNISALVTFFVFHSVNFSYGLVMGLAMILGAIVGSRLAIRKGTSYVRPLFIGVTVLLIGKQIYDFMHK